MKLKTKKFISVISSAVLTVTAACSIYTTDIIKNIETTSAPFIVCAEGSLPEENGYQADIYYIVVDELDDSGYYTQWYTVDDTGFTTKGVHVMLNGEDITSECGFAFEIYKPSMVYDGKNFDYQIPLKITSSNYDTVDAYLPVKIGQKGDVNMDHQINARDSSAITRDIEYYNKHKKSQLSEFAQFLATRDRTNAYTLSMTNAKTLANTLAKEALKRADGEKFERKGDGDYSVSISNAFGLPGETVTMQIVVDTDDTFESLDALIEWDDDTLKSAAAVSVNGTLCESYAENGVVSIVDYSAGGVADGAIASIDFIIPDNAVPGTDLEVYFSDIETFAVYEDGITSDVSNVVNVAGASISVLKPSASTTTTAKPGSSDTTQTTVSPAITTKPDIDVIPVEQGDANLDGTVDVRDAAYIARLIAANEASVLPNVADYNCDGKKNVRDAAAIAKFLSIKHAI